MIDRIDSELGFHRRALSLLVYRQQVLASNIANADTPNYKARDIDFKASLQSAMAVRPDLVRTASRHFAAADGAPDGVRLLYRKETQSSVDGNTVDMDVERAAFAENALRYEAGLTFINQILRQVQSALQAQ
jgi:flagellar basal-body rod protein FlgB